MSRAEEILEEEVLRVTKGMPYEHNVTHQGIINAMFRYAEEMQKECPGFASIQGGCSFFDNGKRMEEGLLQRINNERK